LRISLQGIDRAGFPIGLSSKLRKTKKSTSKSVIDGAAPTKALQDFFFCVCYRNSLHLSPNVNGKGESVVFDVASDISVAKKRICRTRLIFSFAHASQLMAVRVNGFFHQNKKIVAVKPLAL
jgi:hypothetical protein